MTDEQAKGLAAVVLEVGKRAALREWLDRPPPVGVRGEGTPWRRWFDGGEYLGQRSARTGPDGVGAQACGCEVCQNGRHVAALDSGRVQDTKGSP